MSLKGHDNGEAKSFFLLILKNNNKLNFINIIKIVSGKFSYINELNSKNIEKYVICDYANLRWPQYATSQKYKKSVCITEN